jgi:hypothetical protein
MHHWFGTLVLLVAGLFSLLTAWSSGSAPREFGTRLQLAITTGDGCNEIRAQS